MDLVNNTVYINKVPKNAHTTEMCRNIHYFLSKDFQISVVEHYEDDALAMTYVRVNGVDVILNKAAKIKLMETIPDSYKAQSVEEVVRFYGDDDICIYVTQIEDRRPFISKIVAKDGNVPDKLPEGFEIEEVAGGHSSMAFEIWKEKVK